MTKPTIRVDEPSYCRGTAVRLLFAGLVVVAVAVRVVRK